jgi:hypothetical protein
MMEPKRHHDHVMIQPQRRHDHVVIQLQRRHDRTAKTSVCIHFHTIILREKPFIVTITWLSGWLTLTFWNYLQIELFYWYLHTDSWEVNRLPYFHGCSYCYSNLSLEDLGLGSQWWINLLRISQNYQCPSTHRWSIFSAFISSLIPLSLSIQKCKRWLEVIHLGWLCGFWDGMNWPCFAWGCLLTIKAQERRWKSRMDVQLFLRSGLHSNSPSKFVSHFHHSSMLTVSHEIESWFAALLFPLLLVCCKSLQMAIIYMQQCALLRHNNAQQMFATIHL